MYYSRRYIQIRLKKQFCLPISVYSHTPFNVNEKCSAREHEAQINFSCPYWLPWSQQNSGSVLFLKSSLTSIPFSVSAPLGWPGAQGRNKGLEPSSRLMQTPSSASSEKGVRSEFYNLYKHLSHQLCLNTADQKSNHGALTIWIFWLCSRHYLRKS